MKYRISYFNRRVQAEIESWPVGLLASYSRLIELLMEFGTAVRMPYSRALGDGLFELRPHTFGAAGRAFYCFAVDNDVVILHAIIKKTQATPPQAMRTARKRMRDIQHG